MIHKLLQRSSVVVVGFERITWEKLIYRDMEFKKARDCFIFGSESIAMGNEEYATTFVVSEF